MINFYLSDSGIFKVTFSGTVTAEDITKYLLEFESLNNLPQAFLSLYDLRDANMDLKIIDILSISKLTKKVTSSYETVRTAFLVNKPNLTAYSILFTRESSHKKSVRRVFSTEEAAIKWLNN